MENQTFTGIGHNPDGPDLPVGFGMQLAQDPSAMATFGKMSKDQKYAMVNYIQGSSTGEEAEHRVEGVIQRLSEGQIQF